MPLTRDCIGWEPGRTPRRWRPGPLRRCRCRCRGHEKDRVGIRGRGGPDAHLASFGEFERVRDEVAQDLRNLAFVGVQSRGRSAASSKISATASPTSKRPQHAAQRAEQTLRGELDRRRPPILPASTLARSSRSLTSSVRLSAALRMKLDLLFLLRRQLAVGAVQQQPRQRQDRVQRRAELVAHVGQEVRLQLVGPPQMVGPLVQFGIQRDDAAIGVLQFLVELVQLLLPRAAVPPAARRISWFCCAISSMASAGPSAASASRDRAPASARSAAARARGRSLPNRTRGAPPGADSISKLRPSAAARRRRPRPMPVGDSCARQHGLQIGDARPLVADTMIDRSSAALVLDRGTRPARRRHTRRRCARSPKPRWRSASGPARRSRAARRAAGALARQHDIVSRCAISTIRSGARSCVTCRPHRDDTWRRRGRADDRGSSTPAISAGCCAGKAGIGVEVPACGQPVGMQDHQRACRWQRIGELAECAAPRGRRCRCATPCGGLAAG